jgi:hypothetical protein
MSEFCPLVRRKSLPQSAKSCHKWTRQNEQLEKSRLGGEFCRFAHGFSAAHGNVANKRCRQSPIAVPEVHCQALAARAGRTASGFPAGGFSRARLQFMLMLRVIVFEENLLQPVEIHA